jgi:hypothetical protein
MTAFVSGVRRFDASPQATARESPASWAKTSPHVIPAQAGIQYPRASMISTKTLQYWFARLRERSGSLLVTVVGHCPRRIPGSRAFARAPE